MALLVKPGCDVEVFEIPPSSDTSLKTLQDAVGGLIQIVPCGAHIDGPAGGDFVGMICNEEGKINGMPLNKEATAIYGRWLNSIGEAADPIMGPAIFFKDGEVD